MQRCASTGDIKHYDIPSLSNFCVLSSGSPVLLWLAVKSKSQGGAAEMGLGRGWMLHSRPEVQESLDVTIRHPLAVKYAAQAARSDGAAARIAEASKRERYPASAAAGLQAVVPFAVETFGRLGSSALRLLHGARQRAIERDELLRGWAGTAMFQRWLCLLSCGLQTSLFTAVQAMRGASGMLVGEVPARGSAVMAALPFASVTGKVCWAGGRRSPRRRRRAAALSDAE